jgi:hypothetical protein
LALSEAPFSPGARETPGTEMLLIKRTATGNLVEIDRYTAPEAI